MQLLQGLWVFSMLSLQKVCGCHKGGKADQINVNDLLTGGVRLRFFLYFSYEVKCQELAYSWYEHSV